MAYGGKIHRPIASNLVMTQSRKSHCCRWQGLVAPILPTWAQPQSCSISQTQSASLGAPHNCHIHTRAGAVGI